MDEALPNRLRAHADDQLVAIPGTDGRVQAALGRLGELLGWITAWKDRRPTQGADVDQLDAGWIAAVRLASAVRSAHAQSPAQPLSPDGVHELEPLAWAVVESGDVVELGRAAQALGQAWALGHDQPVVEPLAEMARLERRKPEGLIADAARVQGLLALPWDDDVSQLARVLPAGGGPVVLTQTAHAGYQRVLGRILGIWTTGASTGWGSPEQRRQSGQQPFY